MRNDTIETIRRRKIIAIVRGLPAEQLIKLAGALLAGGISLIEVTFAQNAPRTWRDTAAGIRGIGKEFAGQVIPGAGTVLSEEQLLMAAEAGAEYMISPGMDETLIRKTRELGLVSIPGAFTATEIVNAYRAGADFVKVFPAGGLGPGYIKALKAPLPHIPLLAVGGVDEKNTGDFLRAGASGVGAGGSLVRRDLIAEGRFGEITALAREYVLAAEQ